MVFEMAYTNRSSTAAAWFASGAESPSVFRQIGFASWARLPPADRTDTSRRTTAAIGCFLFMMVCGTRKKDARRVRQKPCGDAYRATIPVVGRSVQFTAEFCTSRKTGSETTRQGRAGA